MISCNGLKTGTWWKDVQGDLWPSVFLSASVCLALSGSQDSDPYTHLPCSNSLAQLLPREWDWKGHSRIFTGRVPHGNSHPSHSAFAFPPPSLYLSLGQSVSWIPFLEHLNCLAFFFDLEVPQRLLSIDMASVDKVLVLEVTCNSCVWTHVSTHTDSTRRSKTVSRNWASQSEKPTFESWSIIHGLWNFSSCWAPQGRNSVSLAEIGPKTLTPLGHP